MTDIDLFGDDEHPAAYDDEPTAILHNDPEWHRFADWHLRKLGELEDRAAAVRTRFIDAISQLESRMGAELEKIDKQIRWHATPLRELHAKLIADDPSLKTIVLPSGRLKSSTPVKPKPRFTDKAAFEAWAHEHAPHLLEVVFKPDIAAVEKDLGDVLAAAGAPVPGAPVPIVTGDGEVVPGVELALGHPTFTPKPEGVL